MSLLNILKLHPDIIPEKCIYRTRSKKSIEAFWHQMAVELLPVLQTSL